MACSQTGTDFDPFLPRDLFTEDSITTKLSSTLTLDTKLSGSHSLDIIAETLQDSDLAPGNASSIPSNDPSFPLEEVVKRRGELLRKYTEKWTIDVNDKALLNSKIEELITIGALIYGVAGLQDGASEFNADFFTYVSIDVFVHELYVTCF